MLQNEGRPTVETKEQSHPEYGNDDIDLTNHDPPTPAIGETENTSTQRTRKTIRLLKPIKQ